ncbi:hypothetical protein G4O51_05105 [Candidatus Bathyarchaeota archaeon A05DMB-2]|nr:hypothetical protein [Candidatus Bathyarchaeota archaeon A05DMB-2]
MITLSKKRKQVIAVTAIALVLIVTLPCVAYAESPSTSSTESNWGTRLLGARGIAVEKIDDQAIVTQANFKLILKPTEVNATIIKFNVISGTVQVNGTSYTITSGNGAVIRDKHAFLLQVEGTGPSSEPITLKLAGRYFWMWGHLYVARIAGLLQSDNAKTLLLLRAAIRV